MTSQADGTVAVAASGMRDPLFREFPLVTYFRSHASCLGRVIAIIRPLLRMPLSRKIACENSHVVHVSLGL